MPGILGLWRVCSGLFNAGCPPSAKLKTVQEVPNLRWNVLKKKDRISFRPWLQQCALRLHQRWPTVPLKELELVAMEVWFDAQLRLLLPAEAAAIWLEPVEKPIND
jgi:hypothetical protein